MQEAIDLSRHQQVHLGIRLMICHEKDGYRLEFISRTWADESHYLRDVILEVVVRHQFQTCKKSRARRERGRLYKHLISSCLRRGVIELPQWVLCTPPLLLSLQYHYRNTELLLTSTSCRLVTRRNVFVLATGLGSYR